MVADSGVLTLQKQYKMTSNCNNLKRTTDFKAFKDNVMTDYTSVSRHKQHLRVKGFVEGTVS